MAKFNVEYADGTKKVEEQSDCATVEQFISCRFGTCDTSKVKVTLDGEEKKPVAVKKPAVAKAK